MPECRIVWFDGDNRYECNHGELIEGMTDWDLVEEEDLKILKRHIKSLSQSLSSRPLLIVKDDVPITARIKQIKDLIEEQKQKEELARIKKEQADLLKAAKKAETHKLAHKQKLELFEKLKQELGEE